MRKTIVEWFGYTRKERIGSVILLILIFITLIAKHILVNDHSDNYLTSSYVQIPVMEDADIVIYDSVIEKREQTKTVIKREIVELNSCDSAALEALPGIGPVLSARIIRYRNLLGGFYDVGQLREVYGLSEETFSLIEGRVRVDTSLVQRVSVNFAEYGTLLRMPYLEKEDVDNIMRY
ncbi:MAG: helix-hairpin-helix domain-containing protein, partial [Bacteroidales bacterium]|nr:helix-hairpin-helix domain-containing protein [Bacteroidales bacterium]